MTQEIITYIILAATACFIAYKMFYPKSAQKKNSCGGCEASCSGCELKDLKHQIAETQKKRDSITSSGN